MSKHLSLRWSIFPCSPFFPILTQVLLFICLQKMFFQCVSICFPPYFFPYFSHVFQGMWLETWKWVPVSKRPVPSATTACSRWFREPWAPCWARPWRNRCSASWCAGTEQGRWNERRRRMMCGWWCWAESHGWGLIMDNNGYYPYQHQWLKMVNNG